MKKKWMVVLLIVIAVAAGGGYFWYQKSHAPQKDNYTVGAVSRAAIGLTIDATGISTEKEIEVTSGLSEGQEIVVSGTVSQEKTSTPTNKNNRHGPGGPV